MDTIIEQVALHRDNIYQWLRAHEYKTELPLYSSVDIRDAGFKRAVVDTNLFPAGFNNLCEHGRADSVGLMREAILRRVPHCRAVLIIAEEHTRNTWYLENIRILRDIIAEAGFRAVIATFLYVQPPFCQAATTNYVELTTATGHPVDIYCLKNILEHIADGTQSFDLIILNNDLTAGIPDILRNANVPIYPALQAGWHARQKSHHFAHTAELMEEFSRLTGLDGWLFSCRDAVVDNIDINADSDRARLMDSASDLFRRISEKYAQYAIGEKPYIVIKSDFGTYGMGVLPIEDPADIARLNRADRNRLRKGKGARVISRYLLQEGIPTIHTIDKAVSEVVIYQIANKFVGGFYRSHAGKTNRDNLNSPGMDFKKMCPHDRQYAEGAHGNGMNEFDLSGILARIAGIAAHREIVALEATGL